jgi:hypothetical protein
MENKESKISTESILKIITSIIALITIIVGIIQYTSSRANEFKKAFWTEQLTLYKKATSLAATLAVSKNLNDVEEDREDFWKLYWGQLSIIEHPEVKDAMVEYGNQLYEVEKGNQSTSTLRQLSYNLARACRKSLAKTWEPVNIGDLDDKK